MGSTLGIGSTVRKQDRSVGLQSPMLMVDRETLSRVWSRMGGFSELMTVREGGGEEDGGEEDRG